MSKQRFCVIGLGNFGASVAEALYELNHDVIAVDLREEMVDRIAAHVSRAAVGDGRRTDVLERLGAEGADVGIVSTGDDIASSVLATMALRDLEVEKVYVKVISHDHARVMSRLGVTEAIFPERATALDLASRLSARSVVKYVHFGEDFSVQEMVVPEEWQGHSLRQLKLRQQHHISVIGVKEHETNRLIAPPDPDASLRSRDTLVVAGRDEDLHRIAEM